MDKKHKMHLIKHALKRFAAGVTAVAAALLMFPAADFHSDAYTFTEGDFEYSINAASGKIEATIVRFAPATAAASAPIPQKVNGYTVTSIGPNAFVGNADVKTISIPSTVTSIGQSAFQNCTGLTTVNIPQTVAEIPDFAFKGCSSLKAINLPSSVKKIGYDAFRDCIALDTAPLTNGLEYIGAYAFKGCTAMKTAKIPDTVTDIGAGAFEECSALETLTISKALKTIPDYCFYGCRTLKTTEIPNSVTTIGRYAFAGCVSADRTTGLSSIELPNSVETIAASAFEGSTLLAVAIVPNSVTDIGANAFANTPVEIYGYSGSNAHIYAVRNRIPFKSYGAVYNLTFSVDTFRATIDNVVISTPNGIITPPTTVIDGEKLTITVSSPSGYDLVALTVNGENFVNGGTYTVDGRDVDIFASYRPVQATTTTPATTQPPATSSSTTTTTTTPAPATVSSSSSASREPDQSTDDSNGDTTLDVRVESELDDVSGVKVRMITEYENFIGSAVIRVTNTEEAYAAAEAAASTLGAENYLFYAFDITPYDVNGKENTGLLVRGDVKFQVPIPSKLLPYADSINIYHIVDGKPQLIASNIIEDVSGTKRVHFAITGFSPYMMFADTDEIVPIIIDDEVPSNTSDSGSGNVVPNDDSSQGSGGGVIENRPDPPVPNNHDFGGNTNPHTGVYIAVAVPVITLLCVVTVKKQKRKRSKTPTQ